MSTRLRQEVWALDRCSGCGACVAACSKGVLYWGDKQHPILEERQKALGLSHLKLLTCEVCQKFCEESCPRLTEPIAIPQEEVRRSPRPRQERGTEYQGAKTQRGTTYAAQMTVSARAAGAIQGGSPNAVTQALLVAARSADLIDGAIVPDLDPWTLQPTVRLAATVEEMVSGVGMQYLWAPVLSALNEAIFERGMRKLAVVGTPCVAEGARRLVNSGNERLWPYRQAIRLIVAQFCTGIYLPGLVSELLEKGLGLPRQQIKGLSTRVQEGQLVVTLWDGGQRVIPLTEVERFTRRGCGSCSDYLGESADVAVGELGTAAGHATLLARTPGGLVAVETARQLGLLETVPQVDGAVLDAAKAQKDRRTRAQAFDQLRILMLDGLGDLKKREQVRRQVADLYGTPLATVDNKGKEDCHGHCDGC